MTGRYWPSEYPAAAHRTTWHRLGRSPALIASCRPPHAAMLLVRTWRIQLCFAAVGTSRQLLRKVMRDAHELGCQI